MQRELLHQVMHALGSALLPKPESFTSWTYSRPQKLGDWVKDYECWDSLYITLKD